MSTNIVNLKGTKVLILGASGLLGSRLYFNFSKDYEITGTCNKSEVFNSSIVNLDVTKAGFTESIVRVNPDIIINCIAFTDVNKCEDEQKKAWYLNAEVPKIVAKLSKNLGAKFVHISTDHFEKPKILRTSEIEESFPVNYYGKSKLAGEDYVQRTNKDAVIIRTNFFGAKALPKVKNSFFETVFQNLKTNSKTAGFSNIYFTPISIGELSKAIKILMHSNLSGVYQVCGNESISKFDFYRKFATVMNCEISLIDNLIYVPSADSAKRPIDMSMNNTSYTLKTGHKIPSYNEMLNAEYSLLKTSK
jgi:dTDP-4-dehydrorhamnose reductase